MIFDADVNFLAVALGAIAVQPLGAVWYSTLFQEPWMRLRGYTTEDVGASAGPAYAVGFLASLLVAYMLSRVVDMVGAESVGDCIAVGAFLWVGFAAPVQATQIAFSKTQSVPLFAIEGGYQLASFALIGLIVGLFQ